MIISCDSSFSGKSVFGFEYGQLNNSLYFFFYLKKSFFSLDFTRKKHIYCIVVVSTMV